MSQSSSLSRAQALTGPWRVPFLPLTPALVLLGIGVAAFDTGAVNIPEALLVLAGALSAQIAVNALNEYSDFRSGLDQQARRTPFSGGSGALPQAPGYAPHALASGLIALAVCSLVGLYFVFVRGWGLLPLGLVGLLSIVLYTPWLTRSPLLCLVAPGLGCGPCMVMGTAFALTGTYTWAALVASLVPFFLVSDLLLLNQFPDVDADRAVGRNHLPIRIGRRKSSWIYAAFLALAYLTPIVGVVAGVLPPLSLLGLLTLPLALNAARGAMRFPDQIDRLIPFMAQNVILNLATPVLIAIGLFLS